MARRTRHISREPATFTVAIVGRPNVGKSTLFNRLIGRRSALVHDRPGVTRDRREGRGQIGDLVFTAIDTAGYEEVGADTLGSAMRRQTEKAVAAADAVMLLVDARAGITPLDRHFGDLVRKTGKPVVLVANKCEGKGTDAALLEAYQLGLGEPLAVSAEHGQGLDALYEALLPFGPPPAKSQEESEEEFEEDSEIDTDAAPIADEPAQEPDRPLQLAIVGRPNTGKSTLTNRLLGEERMLTGPEPGVTRDAIASDWTYKNKAFRLVDTAGVRRRPRITDAVEKLSVGDTFEAIRLAEVVVLVIDATEGLDKQDLTLARHTVDEGRALVIAVNKWDAVRDKKNTMEEITIRVQESLAQVRGLPVLRISAKNGTGLDGLMDAVLALHGTWNTHVATGALNRWLGTMTAAHPPPLSMHKQRIKLRYMSQVKTRPPTFVIFSTRAGDLPDAYMRYLANGLRDTFDLDGVPIRISLRKPKNPFVEKTGKGR